MRNIVCVSALFLVGTGACHGQQSVSSTVVDDVFANGNSQLQDLPNNSMFLFNGRSQTIRTDAVGSMTADVTAVGSSSEAFWAYFTNPGSPIVLGVGDTLSVSVTFSLSGFLANAQDIRWGVLNSLGTRNTTNLTGGMNDSTFVGDTGYGLDYYPSGAGSPFVIGRRTTLSSANVFNSFGDFAAIPGTGANARQPLIDDTNYTLTYTITSLSPTDTQITTMVTGGTQQGMNYTSVESSPQPYNAFDYFAFRFSGTSFTTKITWYELLVQYTPAPPVITSQPQPSSLTLQVGSNVTMAVGANGANLNYQWLLNGSPVQGNPSAATATLSLTNVQHSDAGSYAAQVTNAGGSVTSNPVVLSVSDTPVPPPPGIVTQPSNTTVTLGGTATLSVSATGDGLFYQWFKNGVLILGTNAAQLVIPNAQIADAGSYSVVVSNSSGSITSSAAALLVVSPMKPLTFAPSHAAGICNDTVLSVTFDQAPVVGATGRILITNSTGQVVDTIDMSSNPQTRTIGGAAFVYYPIIVTGNTAAIYPHTSLPYGDSYSVTMDPGVLLDPAGAPFTGISDPNLWTFSVRSAGPAPGSYSLAVAADGTGDFCTVQAAIDFVPANNTTPVLITVANGIYTEINYVPSNKPFITVHGEDRDRTVIQYANNNTLNGGSRAKFGIDAPDFILENITVWNTTPHGGSQAEAVRGNNSRILLNRVNLKSYQDTLWLQGLGFVTDSYIEGDVDFMWGYGAIYFENSELKALTSGGYYTQIRNGQGQVGNVYVNCRLTAADGVTGSYLARIDPTQFPYSQVVYINCPMGSHVAPAGWLLNNSNAAPYVSFWEYGTTDLNGGAVDLSRRLNVSRQLSAQEAAQWSDPSYVLGGWVPWTVNVTGKSVGRGGTLSVNFSAGTGHSGDDFVGLFNAGDGDTNPLTTQKTGSATIGHLTFTAPQNPGTYEFRYFLNDGYTRAASSATFVVQ